MEAMEKMRQSLLAEAKAEAERLLAAARRDAESVVAEAEAKALQGRTSALAAAERAAAERRGSIMAGVQSEIRRRWLEHREEIFQKAFDRALASVAAVPFEEKLASLQALAAEALLQIGPMPATISLPAAYQGRCGEGWLAGVRAKLGPEFAAVALQVVYDDRQDDGVVALAPEGRRRVDNTYRVRLERCAEEFRARLVSNLPETLRNGPQVRRS